MKLENKVAVVTGGGGGIGRAIALRFSREGAALLLAGPTEEKIRSVESEIRNTGGRALAVLTDVADEPSVERMVSAALHEFGAIDVLVNNAGIAGPTALVPNVTREEWDQTFAVNVTGAFLCAKHTLPHMIERRRGCIINITSIAGLQAYAYRSPYCASKWGMIGLTLTLAEEGGRYGITANAIAPGPVRGPRIERVIRSRAEEMKLPYEDVVGQYVEPTALKRMVEEEDIAAMAAFLASDEGRNITGETLNISAGYRLS
ncbi:MAG TPA: SDR family NAD(P)-dependent oxidoreductase [Blastocatellia bacterium]|nr:SDR family NAD(P)-dependent oxidoreductase [Blastocatellia bacterium]